MKLPSFQFYPGDWRKDPGIQSLDFECRGVWWEMLCLMHESDCRGVLLLNGKKMSESALARLLGIDPILLNQILTKLLEHGVASVDEHTGAICNRRMVRDEQIRQIRTEAGKKGGNPRLLNQNGTNPQPPAQANANHQPKQIQTPSSSSSSSSSEDLPPTPKGEGLTARLQASAEKQKAIAEIYAAYPKKVGKPAALKAIAKALLAVDSPTLLQKTSDFAAAVAAWPVDDRRFVPHPATWFNQERYNDDPAEWTRSQPANFTASRNGAPPKAEAPRRIYTQHPEPACDWREHPAVVALYDGGFGRDVQWDTLPMEGQIEIIEAIARKETTP